MNPLSALRVAARLEQLGIVIRSAELREQAERHRHFAEHGNRELRRGRARAARKRGRGWTR